MRENCYHAICEKQSILQPQQTVRIIHAPISEKRFLFIFSSAAYNNYRPRFWIELLAQLLSCERIFSLKYFYSCPVPYLFISCIPIRLLSSIDFVTILTYQISGCESSSLLCPPNKIKYSEF